MSGDTESVLGYDREYLIGRPITELFPLLRDAPERETPSSGSERTYQLSDVVLPLRDGGERLIESCVTPRYRDGAFAGYRVFAMSKQVANA
jgi:PAS domain-containing protein